MSKFDHIIDRYNTNSLKYDFNVERGKPADLFPLWVADMDFKASDEILNRLHQQIDHGIFGYSEPKDEYYNALTTWFKEEYDFEVSKDWIVKMPGVVPTLALAVQAFTNPGDHVAILSPVYYPFYTVVKNNDRIVEDVPLIYSNASYSIDFELLENAFALDETKLFLLCNPHNPVGRVWKEDELNKIVELAKTYQVTVVSDEIHMDLVYKPHKHLSFGVAAKDYDQWIVATAASKTFNVAGLQVANIIIKNEHLRDKFKKQISKIGYSQLNVLGLLATQEAYKSSKSYVYELKDYLYENYKALKAYIEKHIPYIKVLPLEGTYLVWLDFSAFGLSEERITEILQKDAKLWLHHGTLFGPTGQGFQRINIALPKSKLLECLEKIKNAFEKE